MVTDEPRVCFNCGVRALGEDVGWVVLAIGDSDGLTCPGCMTVIRIALTGRRKQ